MRGMCLFGEVLMVLAFMASLISLLVYVVFQLLLVLGKNKDISHPEPTPPSIVRSS